MGNFIKTVLCFSLMWGFFCHGFSSESLDAREGTCTDSSQIIFLTPPEDFSPRFEVSGCYCEYRGNVLFLFRTAGKPQGLSWCVPGGKLKKGETPSQAIIREVKEEIDLTLKEETLIYCRPVYVRFPSTDFILHLFRYPFINEPPLLHLALEEHTDYRWVTYEEVSKLALIPGGRECFCIAFKDKLY